MKRLLLVFALLLSFVATALATDITIQSVSIPNFQYQGQTLRGNCTTTASNAVVTFSSPALPAGLVGVGGYKILIDGVEYQVSNTDSTGQITLSSLYSSTSGTHAYVIYPVVQLRIFSNTPFQPKGKTYIVQTGNVQNPNTFYKRIGCTLRPDGNLVIPSFVLDASNDCPPTDPNIRPYSAYFFTSGGQQIRAYDGFSSFRLNYAQTNPTWADIWQFNRADAIREGIDNSAYSGPVTTQLIQNVQTQVDILNTQLIYVDRYGAKGDGIRAVGSVVAGLKVFISTTPVFSKNDVGKVIYIEGAGNLNVTGGVPGLLSTTIAEYVSPTQVTLNDAAIATAVSQYFSFGTDNQAAFDAAKAVAIAAGNSALSVNSLGIPLARGNRAGSGTIQLGAGNYIISGNYTLPLSVNLNGVGMGTQNVYGSLITGGSSIWSPYSQVYTAPINGIIQTAGFVNGSTTSMTTISNLSVVALEQTGWQANLHDIASSYLRVKNVRMLGGHWNQIMDQSELTSASESIYEPYSSVSNGKFNLGVAPETVGFTKTGSVASGIEPMVYPDDCWQCGRVVLNTSGTQTTSWYKRIGRFHKGFLFQTKVPEVVSFGGGTGAVQSVDDGYTQFQIRWQGYVESAAGNWASATSYVKYQVVKATASVGGFTSGQAIKATSTRTSSGTFDASEAANWTSATQQVGFKVNTGSALFSAGLSDYIAIGVLPGGQTANIETNSVAGVDTVITTVAYMASSGTAALTFGDTDATNGNNASVYWNSFEWWGSYPTSAGLWMPAGDDDWKHRETYTFTGASIRSGDNQVICSTCSMGTSDLDKSITVIGAGTAGANLTSTIKGYYGDGFVFLTADAAPSDTSFTVDRSIGIPFATPSGAPASTGAWLYAGGEAMFCTGSTSTSITGCSRGLLGTTAQSFTAGDGRTVSFNVYRTYQLAAAASTTVSKGSLTMAPSGGPEFVNVIQVYNNQFNGGDIQVSDEGGYNHKYSGNNHNGGGTALRITGSHAISVENQDFEGQQTWPIVIGGRSLIHTTETSSQAVDIMHNGLANVKIIAGSYLNFENNQFGGGFGSSILNASAGSVTNLHANNNQTQGARLFQQNTGMVEGNSLGGLVPIETTGGLGVANVQTRITRPSTGPLELHYNAAGAEETPRGALGSMTAGSKTITITAKNSQTSFHGYGGDTSGQTDVGKILKLEYAGAADNASSLLTTTIASVTDSTHAVLVDAAVQTVYNTNAVWYAAGPKTPAVTFYDAYDLNGANWLNGPSALSAPTLTVSAISDYSGTVAGTVRATVNSISANTSLTLGLGAAWTTGSITLKVSGTTDYNHYSKTATYIDDTHVYWTDTYTSSQTGTLSYLAATDPTAPASTISPINRYARIQGLTGYTQNQTVNMLDASGTMGVTSSVLAQNAWLTVDSSHRVTGDTTYATLNPTNGQGMVRQLTIKAATSGTATDTMLSLQAYNGSSGWLFLYDYPAGWLTLQDGVASRQQLTVIANATYDYFQLHANEGINFAGYSTSHTGDVGFAKNASNKAEINRGLKTANGGATGDLILRNIFLQGSGASTAVYNEFTGTPTGANVITIPDYAGNASTLVASSPALTAGRVPFGVAIGSGVGLTDSANFTWDNATSTFTAQSTAGNTATFALGQTGVGTWYWLNIATTGNMVLSHSSAGSVFRWDASTGNTSTDNTAATARFNVKGMTSTTIGQIIKLAASQSADALEVQASDSSVRAYISAAGIISTIGAQSGVGTYGEFRLGNSFTRIASGDSGGAWGGGYNFDWNNASPKHDSTGPLAGFGWTSGGGFFLYTKTNQAAGTSVASAARMNITLAGLVTYWNGALVGFSSTTDAGAAQDLALYRNGINTLEINNGTAGVFADLKLRQLYADATMTAGGTTGAQTINKSAGSVNFAIGATSLVVTDSLVTTSSIVVCSISTNDATFTGVQCVPAAGSFTIYANAAATAETKVAFIVINK